MLLLFQRLTALSVSVSAGAVVPNGNLIQASGDEPPCSCLLHLLSGNLSSRGLWTRDAA